MTSKYLIAFPSLDRQEDVISEINSQILVIDGLSVMKDEAEIKIGKILADVWGVEFTETIKTEVEDEQEN